MLRPKVAALLSVTLLAFVLIDLAAPWVVRHHINPNEAWGSVLWGAMFGVAIGQVTLIGTWSTFASQRAAVRFWRALLMLVGLSLLLLSGMHLEGSEIDLPALLAILSGLVFVCFAMVQLPLWMAARLFGWQFTQADDVPENSVGRKWQFHIKHIIAVMLLSAVLLAAWQWGVVEMLPTKLQRAATVILVYVFPMFNPLVSLPWIWITFQPRRRLLVSAITGIAISVMVTLVQQWVLLSFHNFEPSEFLLILSINICQCLTVAGVLLLFRWNGYRLSARALRP